MRRYRRMAESKADLARAEWLEAVDGLVETARRRPGTKEGVDALLMAADLAGRLFRRSGLPSDRQEALSYYRAALRQSKGAKRAADALALFMAGPEKSLVDERPKGARANGPEGMPSEEQDRKLISSLPVLAGTSLDLDRLEVSLGRARKPARIGSLQCWHAAGMARVVVGLSRPVRFSHGLLQGKRGNEKARLYLDVGPAFAGGSALKKIRPGPLVNRIRMGKRGKDSVRVVMEISPPARFKIYPLFDPFRVVVDLAKPGERPAAALPVRVVAVDPGHGGRSRGAVGRKGLQEKDVVLQIARHVERALGAHKIKVVMTRTSDRDVSLEERTAVALAAGADIFVSVHANAEPTGKRLSVETYYLDVSSDDFARRLAERENASGRSRGKSHQMLIQLVEKAVTEESARLAASVQKAVLKTARTFIERIQDGGVRKAVFYVLLTARVPAILAEVSHLSHPEGEAFLGKPEARKALGLAIANGVLEYIEGRKKTSGRTRQHARSPR